MAQLYKVQDEAASLNEYNVSLGIEFLKLPYRFQYSPMGYHGLKGQYILDFWIPDPYGYPIEVYGDWWHMGQLGANDKMRLAVLQKYFRRPIIILWGRDTMTEAQALATLRKELHM